MRLIVLIDINAGRGRAVEPLALLELDLSSGLEVVEREGD